MSHPLLAKMHDVLLKIKNAFKETPYKEKTNGIIRTIEMAYVKTANGTFESSASEESYGERLSAKKRRALETASLGINPRSLTAISSADGAKILQNIDNLILKYKNSSTQPKTFVGEMADALDVDMKDKSSKYANFECKNGNVVTIRISDHNATSSNLDINGQNNAISIVVTNKNNIGIINDGNAHIVEYYYNAIKLRKAEGKPLADIVGAIKQALYSGEFKDPTGLAERQEVNMPNSDENVLYSLRQKPEPEKKGTGYKVFVLGKDGKLYPPMVANPNGAATPVGVWLDADAAPVAGESKTGRPQVKQGGKGTQGGSGKLAYRPGWHLGVIPYAIQFNRKDAEGNKTLFPKNFVFAEVEYAADKDYQDEAHAEGINSNGKYQHSLAGLKHLPTDGYYMYRTNPNPETDPWVITGAMKVNRLLTRAEQADIVRKAGREPQQIQEGDIVTDDVVNSINQEIAAAPKFSLKVYHGTGADFTEFDFDHMGEGAGSQSFGWGGYVTSSKKIGKSYADLNRVRNLPEDIFDTENKKAAASYVQKLITQGYDKESAIQEVRSKYDGFLDNLNHDDTSRKNNGVAILNLKERIATLDEIEEGKLPLPTVSLYEVDIPDDNGSNYLEWEKKPSDEVATKIIEGIYGLDDKTLDDMAARDIVFRTLMYDYIKNADKEQMIPILVKTNGLTRNTVYDNGNVEDDIRFVYNRLSNWMGSPKAASKFLSSLGFTGIKYPAGTIYGGAEEGDVNYVIFKPEDMQIVEHEKFSVKEGINRGYTQRENGDKISKNAYEAEEDGTYSHGTFKRKYKVAARTFPLLQQLGFITNTEWHHTGRNFSKTGFYTWADSDRISGGSISYADGKTQSGSIAAKYKENKQEIDDIVKGLPSKQWEFTKPESTETLSYEAWLSRKIPFREEDYLSKEEQAEKQANHERISADKSTPSYYRGESHKAVDQLYYNVAREHYQKELEDNRQQHEAEYKQYESEFPSKMQKLKEQNLGTNGKEKDLMRIYDLLGYKDSYGQVIKEISRPLATEDIDRVIGDGEKFSVKSKPVRFEIGKKLSDEEKKEVLSTLKDAYKVNGVPYHIEETAGGKEKRVYEPTLDSYVVSDITNRPLRYYITLPDGRVAHPTEVYPNISDNEVKSSATKQGLLDDEADQIVSAAIGNMKGIADNAKAVEVLTELQNLPHETHDIGYGLNNAQSYNYKTGIFTSDAAQAIDYVVRRMRRKEDVPAEIPAALKKAVADSYGMVDNLIDGMSNTKVGATEIKPVGVGAFGNIYNQFRGKAKAAIEFLKKLGNGEAAAALHHHTIGDISLVWGDKKTGLDKILRKHPEVIDNLQSIIDSMEVVLESDNRIKLESPTHFAVVSKEYKGEPREQWLLTAYEKRESLENGKSMDTATSSLGGDTALSQSKESAANIANPSETSKGNAGKFSLRLQDAINETDTEPTEAQKKSGNYKKGHVKFGGYDYTIENPKGSYRSGVDENGKEWKQKMNDTYGYIRGKFGKDGDHLDMFINDKADLDSWNGDVFVVDQVNQDGTFDEHKVMYGYDSLDEAKKAYLSNYEKGWTGLGNITPVSKAGFDKWLDKSNRKLKPFADYADITSKTNMDTAPSSFEEFLEHPAVRYSIRNEKERAAAEDAYNFAQENRPDRYSRYAIVNMEKPGAVPQYLEKKAVADNWRRYYNKLKWGNYKLFDLDKPFEDNVKNLVGKFPETFRKKNGTTLSKINELTADYNKRKEEYDAMSNSIQELLNGLMKQGRSLAEAESVIRDWGLYKEMDSKYQNLMGIRKQLNELRSGKVADDERFSLIGKKGAEALDHAEEVSTRLDNLNVARQMEGAKKDAKAIKMATGWERGADGKWRYEIADSKLNDMMDVDGKGKMVKRHKEDMLWTSGKLGEVVVAPELFKAYPKLKDVRLETDSIMNNLPSNGEYNAKTNTITIHADELKYLDSILNHEIQHAIQHIEGFARGGNPEYLQWRIEAAKKEWRARAWADALRDKAEEMGEHYNQVEVEKALIDEYKEMGMDNDEWMPDKETRIKGFNYFARGYADRSFDDDIRAFRLNESTRSDYNSYVEYTKLGGEVEARNVQSRMNMSPEERRKTLAEETEDVARKDQIFLYGDSVSMMGSRAFNEAINSSDNIRFSLKEEKEKIVSDAKANGTYMTASNGEKTKLNAEQWVTVRTTNFKNWFGDWENDPENASKVVDENGEPMVVWHGRSAEFNTFEKKEGVRFIMGLEDKVKAEGFFFSPNKGLAEEFASNSFRHRGGKANVIPCFLNIRKPMDLTREDYDRIYEDVTGWDYIVGMDTQDNLWGIMDEEGMADKIKEKGYDGAIFVEEVDDSYEPTKISYCALDANQIKSAENNNGDFSADNNDIRFSLKSMMEKPEGWKQANKKAIHIAEAIERDPKFSLKNLDGTLIKAGTYFSGGGLVEEGLKGIIDPVVAVEYDEKISGVYRNNFGNHIVTADVRDVDPKELVGKIDGEVEYFHASPVCKNYSLAKNNHEELELDKETAASTAEFISKVRPKVVTIENVKGYKDSEAMKTITDALDEAGYKWDADVYNAADYGGYTNRERLIVRAVRDGELPANPEKQKRKSGWYEAVEDIMPTLTEKKNGVAPWMDERLKADGIDWRHIDKPLYVMGSGYANGTVPHAFADELLPTLRTKSGDVIVMPDGKVYRAMGRVLARVSGVSDDYQMPASEALSHTIIGNGIPTQLTENVIAPLVRDVLHPAVEEKASLKDADRKQTQLDIILKTNPMLDDYHTGIRKVEDIKTLGESVEEARSEAEKYGDDEWSAYPDITNDMLQNALETGEITIYSSKPIKNGVFVTPSYMQASDYAGGGNVYEKTVPLTDVAWINTDEGQYAKVDGERYSLKEVNDKFNDRLAQLIENPNQKDRVLHLGRSSQFLIDGGIADAEIELDFDKFVRKSSEKYKNNHPFSAGDIKDLPKAIAYPVAVFNSTTKKDHVVMTELNHDGKNFIVAIRATEQNRKNKVVLEVNQITSLYPKGERGIIYWINNNKLSNVDKEKALHFIEALQPHAGTLTSEELSSAANIVRNFVNPKQNDGNLQKTEKYSLRVDRYRDELNQWKKDNNLPKDAERPQLPVREPNDRFGFT